MKAWSCMGALWLVDLRLAAIDVPAVERQRRICGAAGDDETHVRPLGQDLRLEHHAALALPAVGPVAPLAHQPHLLGIVSFPLLPLGGSGGGGGGGGVLA